EDLRTDLVRPGLEEVALGDRVRAVVLRGDPQDLATQVVGVGRGALGVPGRPARALVDRAVPTRGEGVGVVTRGDVQVALAVELQRTTRVTALVPLDRHLEQHLLT